MIIYDATGAIAGRLAAIVAKMSLQGMEVVIVNAEMAVISGNPLQVRGVFSKRREMTNKANPEEASKWPRRPDLLLKRIITGMLPKHSGRGKAAASRIKAYIGVPKEYEGKAQKFEFTAERLANKFISLKELTERI
ncbi:MAG TPA: 50S ribosomal protein L13 [Candidatus Norongarragalinales archaeon]|nr:50S ribosomal protein L13 [Candidatus Norongarragalinales archaeon]